jgi:uncharacterized protein (DUF1501 family)
MFVLGNCVQGGSVFGTVPELSRENLADGRDLPVTTDFRALFSGLANDYLGISDKEFLFPGYSGPLLHILGKA